MSPNLDTDIVPNSVSKLQRLLPTILGKLIYVNMNGNLRDGRSNVQITAAHTMYFHLTVILETMAIRHNEDIFHHKRKILILL